jgi:hypothetical protein
MGILIREMSYPQPKRQNCLPGIMCVKAIMKKNLSQTPTMKFRNEKKTRRKMRIVSSRENM